jgi:hypothetical protein
VDAELRMEHDLLEKAAAYCQGVNVKFGFVAKH